MGKNGMNNQPTGEMTQQLGKKTMYIKPYEKRIAETP
jgi:hypothetical protein